MGRDQVAVAGPVARQPSRVLRSRPVLAAATLLALGAASHQLPGAERFQLFAPAPAPRVQGVVPMATVASTAGEDGTPAGPAEISLETEHRPELAQPERVVVPRARRGPIATTGPDDPEPLLHASTERPPVSIEDPTSSLAPFLAALRASDNKEPGAISRIAYFGDSVVASDFATGTLRRKLQERFGDAGHGFVLIANAWPAYFHNDLYRLASRGWKVRRIVGPYSKDGFYGLGGVSFEAPPGLRARVGTSREGTFGRHVSVFEVAYLRHPHGGVFDLSVDGAPPRTVSTQAESAEVGVEVVEVEDGAHLLELTTRKGSTRLFGFVLERRVPGVVLDALGVVGARIRFLDKQDDAHWAAQLAWRRPALLVFQFGANESGDGFAYSMQDYHQTMKAVLQQAKAAVPGAGCLIVSAMDRARKEGARLVTVPIIPHIVAEQKAVAQAVGCAFWNSFEAMGGEGSMARWVRKGYGAGDFTHPTSVGAEVLGSWIYQALMERYEAHLRGAPAPPHSGAPPAAAAPAAASPL